MRVGGGSMGQGGGYNVAEQEQWYSEITISVDFASSQILRYGHSDLHTYGASYRVAQPATKNVWDRPTDATRQGVESRVRDQKAFYCFLTNIKVN